MVLTLLALLSVPTAGAAPVRLTDALPTDAPRRGAWVVEGGARLSSPAPGHMDVLLPHPTALRDGKVTATVKLGSTPNLTVLARATTAGQPDSDLEGVSAVGLTLLKSKVRWDRWDGGVTLPLTPTIRARESLAGRTVRVELTLAGTDLQGRVLDASTGAVLADLRTVDGGSGSGLAGVRVHRDRDSRLTTMDVTPAVEDDATVHPDPSAPMGDRRMVLMGAEALAALPTTLRQKDLGVWPYDERSLHALLLTPSQVRRLVESGTDLVQAPLVPFWAVDIDVRRAAGQVPLGPEGRPDLSASYKDPAMVEQVLDAWVARHGAICRKVRIGTSSRGRPLWALRITDNPDADEVEPAVLITGATHGSELLSTEYALDAADGLLHGYGSDPAITRRVDSLDLWIVPLVNPDGNAVVHQLTRFGGRKNGRDTTPNSRVDPWEGVDLNRNFPLGFGRDEGASRSFRNSAYFRGDGPLSEPESQAIATLARRHHFVASLSFHTNGSLILAPYTLNGVDNPDPNAAWDVAEQLAAAAPIQPSGKRLRVRKQIYPVDGTDQDWLRHEFGTVALLLEGSHHNPTDRRVRLASVAAVRPVVPTLLDRVIDGPTLTIRVLDGHGKPVQATVEVEGERLNSGEHWRSRTRDGLHSRIMAAGEATWAVTVRAPGFRDQRLTVPPRRGPPTIVVMQTLPTEPPGP